MTNNIYSDQGVITSNMSGRFQKQRTNKKLEGDNQQRTSKQ